MGTSVTRVHVAGSGIVFDEPSVVAFDTESGSVVEVGTRAEEMIGRTAGYVALRKVLHHGAISDFDLARGFLRGVMSRVPAVRFGRSRMLLSVCAGSTHVERRALEDAGDDAGAGEVVLVDQTVAAAIGAGMSLDASEGAMIADLGAGSSEAAAICLGGKVSFASRRVGGRDVDTALADWLRAEHGVAVSERTAEDLKLFLVTAGDPEGGRWAEVKARDAETGEPTTVLVSDEQVSAAVRDVLTAMEGVLLECLAGSPPQLAEDVISTGVMLSGGSALMRGMEARLSAVTQLDVRLASAAESCVIRGMARCLDDPRGFEALTSTGS